MKIERRFVAVEGRRVHYRRAGQGPPVVMLHGSPGDSEMLAHEIASAAEYFTVFALDTPGFGSSDPLPGAMLSVAELAGAIAAAMATLGLPPCPIYGTHTGALIAAELGVASPERVTGLVMEGLPVFTEAEIKRLFEGYGDYFAPMQVDPLAGHLTATWMRFRDQFTWFPWRSREVARLNPVDRPSAAEIHHWVMMFYRSYRSYTPAYKAACYHGPRAFEAAAALTVPAIYMASAEDMLFPHLDRLPPMKVGQSVARLAYDPDGKGAAITGFLRSLPYAPAQTVTPDIAPVGHDPAMQFIDSTGGQVFVRCYGDAGDAALILLHDAPGTGLALEELARKLASNRYVIVPDLPGNGESDAPEGAVLEASADAVVAIADTFGLVHYTLAAKGCSHAVAAIVADRSDPRLTEVLLESMPAPNEALAAAIAPDLPLSPDGAHWIRAWLMVRDGQIYAPWFDGRIAAQRKTQGNFDAQWLHDQTFALMQSRASYHRLPREAYCFDSAGALARAAVPVRIAGPDGLIDLLPLTSGHQA